jgi:hypothetical protein
MAKLLQIDFSHSGPFGNELAESRRQVAQSIAEEPGLIWKIWTENPRAQEGGGIYLFEDEGSASAYLKKHTEILMGFGITDINAKIFDVHEELTKVTKGPIS